MLSEPVKYEWKNLSATISVDGNCFPKCYGLVRRNGKSFYRNYKRPLKNGGLSLIEIYEKKMSDIAEGTRRSLIERLYSDA